MTILKCWRGCEETEIFTLYWWEYKTVQPLKKMWAVCKENEITTTLSINLRNVKLVSRQKPVTRLLVAILFLIAPNWNNLDVFHWANG